MLGAGSEGTVYEAVRLAAPGAPPVAVKVFPRPVRDVENWKKARDREFKNAGLLWGHAGFVRVVESGWLPDGRAYLAMDLCQGATLRELIAKGPLARDRALRLIRQFLDALTYAHDRGILHRDLKPENIIIDTSDDGNERARILDYGLAKDPDRRSQALTRDGETCGTVAYMAHERLRGAGATPASDLFAITVILFEMLTGSLPLLAATMEELIRALADPRLPGARSPAWADLPRDLVAVIERGVAPEFEKRFADAASMAAALESVARAAPALPVRREDVEGGRDGDRSTSAMTPTVRTAVEPGPPLAPPPSPEQVDAFFAHCRTERMGHASPGTGAVPAGAWRIGPYAARRPRWSAGGMLFEGDEVSTGARVLVEIHAGVGRVAEAALSSCIDRLRRASGCHLVHVAGGGLTDRGNPYLVYPGVQGALLTEFRGVRLPLPAAARAAHDVATALAASHAAGIVRGEVTPLGVLVVPRERDGGGLVLEVFGLDLAAVGGLGSGPGLTAHGGRDARERERLRYLAPERLRGKPFDARADVFGAGALFFELLAGRPLRDGTTIEAILQAPTGAPDPENLTPSTADSGAKLACTILERALAPDPTGRYGDAAALARDLEPIAGELTRTDFRSGVAT